MTTNLESPASHRPVLRKFIPAALAAALSAFALTPLAASADVANISVHSGGIGDGQSYEALNDLDQAGNDDDWDAYVEFYSDGAHHHSTILVDPVGNGSEAIEISLNYRGPEAGDTEWVLSVRNFATSSWVEVFSNYDLDEWEWTETFVSLDNPDHFLDSNGRIQFRYLSDIDGDNSELDYLYAEMVGDTAPPTTQPPTTQPPTTQPPTTQPPTTQPPTTQPPTTQPPTTQPPTTQPPAGIVLPPANALFDYQIGEPYALPAGVTVVSRDWFDATPAAGAYNICYVNAFQTQPDDPSIDRPDELSNWPANLILGEDPAWAGEHMIDISTSVKRSQAAQKVNSMVDVCASKGFDAIEFDNLDTWDRIGDPATAPFGINDTVAFASLITNHAHGLGLAVGQKNSSDLIPLGYHTTIGFDFAIAEECGQFNECDAYTAGFGNNVIVIEYTAAGLSKACSDFANQLSIVRRDKFVTVPGSGTYVNQTCFSNN